VRSMTQRCLPKLFFALHASPSDVLSAPAEVVARVDMQFAWPLVWPSVQPGHGRNRINRALERHRIMPVSTRHAQGQRNAPGIYDEVPLAAELAPVRWVRAGFLAPRGLGTLAPSMLAHSQSIWSCSRSLVRGQMHSLPYTGRLPVTKASLACHSAAKTEFLRQVFPRNPCVQDMQDAVQCCAVVHRPTATAFG
jgi:hypothetical protein